MNLGLDAWHFVDRSVHRRLVGVMAWARESEAGGYGGSSRGRICTRHDACAPRSDPRLFGGRDPLVFCWVGIGIFRRSYGPGLDRIARILEIAECHWQFLRRESISIPWHCCTWVSVLIARSQREQRLGFPKLLRIIQRTDMRLSVGSDTTFKDLMRRSGSTVRPKASS